MSAQWIWDKKYISGEENSYVDFLDSFEYSSGKCVITLSADTQFEVWLNDAFVGSGQYPDYSFYKVKEELDLTSFVKCGKNDLRIIVYHAGVGNSVYHRGTAGVIFTVKVGNDIVLESSEKTLCRPNPNYISGKNVPINTVQLGYTYFYDANGKPAKAANAIAQDYQPKLIKRPIKRNVINESKPVELIAQGTYKFNPNCQSELMSQQFYHAFLAHDVRDRFIFNPDENKVTVLGTFCFFDGKPENALHINHPLKGEDGIYLVLDVGREMVGYLDLRVKAKKGTEIYITYGEHLDDMRTRCCGGEKSYLVKYTCSGKDDKFLGAMKRLGLRYIQMFINTDKFDLEYCGLREVEYPTLPLAPFKTSDSLHNKIYEVAAATLKDCMHEHYEDCPLREQALYAMDSRNQILCGYYAFGEYDMPRACLKLLAKGQEFDGLLPITAPSEMEITIPSFSLWWIVELYEYVMYSGDTTLVKEVYGNLTKLIDAFEKNRGNQICQTVWQGHRYWNFLEWTPFMFGVWDGIYVDQIPTTILDGTSTLVYGYALGLASTLAKISGHSADSKKYALLSKMMLDEFDKVFWDKDAGCYASFKVGSCLLTYCEFTNSFAIFAGVANGKLAKDIGELITNKKPFVLPKRSGLNEVEQKYWDVAPKTLSKATLSYSAFKYEALIKSDKKNLDYVLDDIKDQWGSMLYRNATSFWETILGGNDFDNSGSLCHGWSAIPIIIYFKYVLGISPRNTGLKLDSNGKLEGLDDHVFNPIKCQILSSKGTITTKTKKKIEIR